LCIFLCEFVFDIPGQHGHIPHCSEGAVLLTVLTIGLNCLSV